ncbi:hypothetical protein D3C84_1091930 [compost metagenome]
MIVKWMTFFSPALSITLRKFFSSFTGRMIEPVTSWMYSCTTVSPSRLPVFFTVTLASSLPVLFSVVDDRAMSLRLNSV